MLLQERDKRLLEFAKKLGVFSREDAEFIGPFGSVTRANARLLCLVRSGLLRRIENRQGLGRQFLYVSTEKPNRRQPSERFLDHHLAVNAALIRAVLSTDLPGEVTAWTREPRPLHAQIPIIPDGCVTLDLGNAGRTAVYLEVDLGSEPLKRWAQKLIAYYSLAAFGPRHRFQLAVVGNSEKRLMNLRRESEQSQALFPIRFSLLHSIKQQGFWSRIWFGSVAEKEQGLFTR